MCVNGSELNEQSLLRTFHRCFLPSFGSFGQAVSEEKIKKNRPTRNKNFLWRPCLLMDREKMSILFKGPSIDASYQVSVHLAEGFQRRRLKCERLTDDRRRTPSHGKSSLCRWQCELNCKVLSRSLCLIWQYIKQYSLFYILEVFRNRPIRNKNCLWRPRLLTDRDEMSNRYRGPSKPAFIEVWVHLAKRF